MTREEFDGWVRRHRFLYHVTARGSWPSISKHGLLTTNALLAKCGMPNSERRRINRRHRHRCKTLRGKELDGILLMAVIRDQNALKKRGKKLEKEIEDQGNQISLERWYERQNERVFFYPSRAEAVRLACIYAGEGHPQDILVICTRSLVDACRKKIELCAFNSGGTNRKPSKFTEKYGKWHDRLFQSIEDYAYVFWPKGKRKLRTIRELTVRGGVHRIDRHVVKVVSTDDGKECRVVIPAAPNQFQNAKCALESNEECVRLHPK